MSATHDVISDLLDGEAFEPHTLAEALADPVGRDLLIDLVILRYAVRGDDVQPVMVPKRPGRQRMWMIAAAAMVALVGGYHLGHREARALTGVPPAATRIVEASGWQMAAEANP